MTNLRVVRCACFVMILSSPIVALIFALATAACAPEKAISWESDSGNRLVLHPSGGYLLSGDYEEFVLLWSMLQSNQNKYFHHKRATPTMLASDMVLTESKTKRFALDHGLPMVCRWWGYSRTEQGKLPFSVTRIRVWLLFASASWPLLLYLSMIISSSAKKWLRNSRNQCPNCGYRLHGSSSPICSECGVSREVPSPVDLLPKS